MDGHRSLAWIVGIAALTLSLLATRSESAASSFTSLLDLQVSFSNFTPASVSIISVGDDTILRNVRITEGSGTVSSFNPMTGGWR